MEGETNMEKVTKPRGRGRHFLHSQDVVGKQPNMFVYTIYIYIYGTLPPPPPQHLSHTPWRSVFCVLLFCSLFSGRPSVRDFVYFPGLVVLVQGVWRAPVLFSCMLCFCLFLMLPFFFLVCWVWGRRPSSGIRPRPCLCHMGEDPADLERL